MRLTGVPQDLCTYSSLCWNQVSSSLPRLADTHSSFKPRFGFPGSVSRHSSVLSHLFKHLSSVRMRRATCRIGATLIAERDGEAVCLLNLLACVLPEKIM